MRSPEDTLDDVPLDDAFKQQLTTDFQHAQLTDENKLILGFAETVNNEAHTIDKSYIDFLKGKGFTDQMLHDIVQVTAYFNYVNRLADALGVELEDTYKS